MRYLLFCKPYGVLTKFTDTQGRPTLADHIDVADVYPLGRLDADSEGLLLLSDDKALQTQLQKPGNHWKTYWVQVEGVPSPQALEALCQGVEVQGRKTLPARARRLTDEPELWPRSKPIRERRAIPTSWLELSLCEGRNRQVRRMTAAVGFPTLRLLRVGIGELQLGRLKPGEYRDANAAELAWLRQVRKPKTSSRRRGGSRSRGRRPK